MADFIAEKCKELGCENEDEVFELIGGATLLLLESCGSFLEVSFEDMRKEYVRALMEAKKRWPRKRKP